MNVNMVKNKATLMITCLLKVRDVLFLSLVYL